MPTITVVMSEHQWTLEAMHLACALARNTGADVTLVRLLPVTHASYLGASFAYWEFSPADYEQFNEYRETAEDYGVPISLLVVQYIDFTDAVAQAAEQIESRVVFATLPHSPIPYLRRFRLWHLRRLLQRGKRTLYTLDPDTKTPNWKPSITVLAHHK
jgi:hypothetical protein